MSSKTKMEVIDGYATDVLREAGAMVLADAFLIELEDLLERYNAQLTATRDGPGAALAVTFKGTPDYRLRLDAGQLREGLTFKQRT